MAPVHVLNFSRPSRRCHRAKVISCEHCGDELALLPTPKRKLAWSEIAAMRVGRIVTLYYCQSCTD